MDNNLENNEGLVEDDNTLNKENTNDFMAPLDNNLNIVNEIKTENKENETSTNVDNEEVREHKTKENKVYTKPKKNNGLLVFILVLIILAIIGVGTYYLFFKDNSKTDITVDNTKYLTYKILNNGLGEFDLYFLKLENNKVNKLYSPLSIKYALEMLSYGASNTTKEELDRIIGDYNVNKYINSSNASFANALFIKDKYKKNVKEDYINNLKNDFNADVIYDDFKTPDKVNSWVSEKTFNLIKNLTNDISTKDFILVNALAIDMEWVEKLQPTNGWGIVFAHENYYKNVGMFSASGYTDIAFDGLTHTVDASYIAAVANRYDIINSLGEDNVRTILTNEYNAWKEKHAGDPNYVLEDTDTFVTKFMEELNSNYNKVGSSTDFKFYDDENVRMFSKELKEYDGMTLEYIAVMPKTTSLDTYISNMTASNLNELIGKVKSIEVSSFKEGVVTELTAYIPVFKFDYSLNLMDDLKSLGITSVFNTRKADLSNLASGKAYISEATHKANIDFSNDGIKAAAATFVGGNGGGDYRFEYLFDVPVEKIDITFNKPFMFIIRDKNTSEVWFAGTVYEPSEDGGNFNLDSGK